MGSWGILLSKKCYGVEAEKWVRCLSGGLEFILCYCSQDPALSFLFFIPFLYEPILDYV